MATADPTDIINSLLCLLSPIQTQGIGYFPQHLPPRGTQEESLQEPGQGQSLQDQLETALVSPVRSGKRFLGLEERAGWVAVTAAIAGSGGKQRVML